jgi:hypothetical protein
MTENNQLATQLYCAFGFVIITNEPLKLGIYWMHHKYTYTYRLRQQLQTWRRATLIIIIIIYLLQLGLHSVAVVLTLLNYNKIHTMKTSTFHRTPYTHN